MSLSEDFAAIMLCRATVPQTVLRGCEAFSDAVTLFAPDADALGEG